MLLWIRLALFLVLTCSICSYGKVLIKRTHEDQSELPECWNDNSACSYVELNSMGISVQNICRCKNFNSCPDQFDRYDGRTIVHGIGQYKYCEEAPRLRPCSSHDIALVITSESNLETETTDYKLQCLCPKNNIFVLNSTHLRDVDGLTIDAFLFNCKSPEICGFRQPCMTITQTPYTYFEKKVCNCPMDSFCPTDLRYAYQSTISQFNRGSAFYMHCI
ncbi:uncharacterized protein LOC107360059 [Tetranychus urticae]|uniref:uncharacterized protein LOC107360059 n=1 Tax=Tetranychus urticae TaxID=32264 RepID=UPI00077B9E71|nr:uncharacterized protein LOC107360059 [Tetranychus urticae]